MKSVCISLAVIFLSLGIAFGEEDGMEFGLRKIKGRKKVPKTYHTKLATHRDLGKKLNLKAESIAKTKLKKKGKKYKEVNEMFANVEYNTPKKKRPTKDEFFNELKELSDLDQVDKYENKFVKAEGKRAKARRKKEKKESTDSFVAVNTGKVSPKENSFSNQAGGSNLKGKGLVAGSVAGTTFDSFEAHQEEPVEPSVSTAKIPPPPESPENTQRYSYTYETKSKSSSWISLAPVGGYGLLSITSSQDLYTPGAKGWESSDSFIGGVMADLGRGRWQFETGLLYVRSGIKREVNQYGLHGYGADNYMEFIDRDYVAIPLVGVYNFMERYTSNASNFFAKAGLWPMYLTSAKREVFSSNFSNDRSDDVAAFQAKWDTLAILGAGGRIKISNSMAIVIEGYYLRGLTDSFNMTGMSGNTQGFMSSAGISFDL
ncbi:MAG: hypothetical protein A4S09_07795 [Proteobacteria bacterium SG_bin7]|nr:MAG: hypothetical protein A4S09_07795 [Proteobacteria bacterium SG_bin7]